MKCKFSVEDLRKIICWIICKFQSDKSSHLEGKTIKRDLIGGFSDRWIHRAEEFVVFSELLKDKEYYATTDYFLYKEDTAKNAPDVLGLQDKEGNIIVKFTEFIDESWEHIEDMPFIEVKNVKENQYMVSLSDDAEFDDKYFVIVESHIRDDYLITILDDSIFTDDILQKFHMNPDYIKTDKNRIISLPDKIIKIDNLGYFELIGIFKGSEIKKYCTLCKGKRTKEENGEKIKLDAESPFYLRDIYPEDIQEKCSENLAEGQLYYNYDESEIYMPIEIKYLNNPSEVKIIYKRKWSFNVSVEGRIKINQFKLNSGIYRVELGRFDRSASYDEYVAYKSVLREYAEDVTQELLDKFDELVEGK